MKYKVILTHNPQDYFEGAEPDELVRKLTIDRDNHYWLLNTSIMFEFVNRGYKAIVFPQEGDADG